MIQNKRKEKQFKKIRLYLACRYFSRLKRFFDACTRKDMFIPSDDEQFK